MSNQIVWCDIPVLDLERAVRFYAAVLAQQIKLGDMGGTKMGVLPHGEGDVGGCLFASSDEKPVERGILIYLNVNGRLDDAIRAVGAHGGKIVQDKHQIGPFGFRAIVLDSEGNRVALHSE
jgi:uncharacterized protein